MQLVVVKNMPVRCNKKNICDVYILNSCKVFGLFRKIAKATVSFVISVCPSLLPSVWNNAAPTGREYFFFKPVVKFN